MVGEIKRTKNQQILKKLTKVNGACKDMFVCANRWRSVGGGLQIALPTKQFGQKKRQIFPQKLSIKHFGFFLHLKILSGDDSSLVRYVGNQMAFQIVRRRKN